MFGNLQISFQTYEYYLWLFNQINTIAYALAVGLSTYSYILSRNKRRRRNVFLGMTVAFAITILIRISISFDFDNYLARLIVALLQTFFNYLMLYIFFRRVVFLHQESGRPSATVEAVDQTEKVFDNFVRPIINDEPVTRRDIKKYRNSLEYKTQS